MVRLLVKGTRYPDTFVVERRVTDVCTYDDDDDESAAADNDNKRTGTAAATATTHASGKPRHLAEVICHVQNTRHHLQLMLLSARALADDLRGKCDDFAVATTTTTSNSGDDGDGDAAAATTTQGHELSREADAQLAAYEQLVAQLQQRLKDARTPLRHDDEFDEATHTLRAQTRVVLLPLLSLLPTHNNNNHNNDDNNNDNNNNNNSNNSNDDDNLDATVAALHAQYNDPDVDEHTRLRVYHARALLDRDWRAEERLLPEHAAGLWFGGALLRGRLGEHCGHNEKSTLTVKVAPRAGPPPAREPRIDYDAQRALYAHAQQKRRELAQLAEAELHGRVVQQTRARVALPPTVNAAAAGAGGDDSTSPIRMSVPRLQTTRRAGAHAGVEAQ